MHLVVGISMINHLVVLLAGLFTLGNVAVTQGSRFSLRLLDAIERVATRAKKVFDRVRKRWQGDGPTVSARKNCRRPRQRRVKCCRNPRTKSKAMPRRGIPRRPRGSSWRRKR